MELDKLLIFVMHVYHDVPQAACSLREIRHHDPTARLIVIADGDTDPRRPDWCG